MVLLTLRADFYDRPMQYPELFRLIDTQHLSLLAIEPDDLRRVVERPAALSDVQVTFEGNLVSRLLADVAGQVGALPLLQFTLDQLFQQRDGRQLTLSAYHELGGVKGALTRKAEETYAALPSEEHRKLTRALFVRLIDPGASEQDITRRRAALSEFSLAEASQTRLLQEVADAFITARLLTTNEIAGTTTLEVSHEAVIREWERLSDWLRETREDMHQQQTISRDVAEWQRRGKPRDRLYRGSQLKEARTWAQRNIPSSNEVTFLRASAVYRVGCLFSMTAIFLSLISTTGLLVAPYLGSLITAQVNSYLLDPTLVTNFNNTGPGSLRWAIAAARPGSTITFAAGLRGTILLTDSDLVIAQSLTIRGPGAGILSISGGKSGHIIRVIKGVNVTISGLTFKDSKTFDSFISNDGALTLNNSTISGNTVKSGGGGISNQGMLNLNNSTVSGNTDNTVNIISGSGGGISNQGMLNLNNSTVSGNTTSGDNGGGGIYNYQGMLNLNNSTVSGNIVTDGGGGIYNDRGTLTLNNSTISGNTATGGYGGGGIYSGYGGTLTLNNSTVSGNTVTDGSGGIFIKSIVGASGSSSSVTHVDITFSTISGNTAHGGGDIAIEDITFVFNGQEKPSKQISQVKISNSIVAGDSAHRGPDIAGMLTSYGFNLFQDNSGATFDPATRTQHRTDKLLSVNDLPKMFASPVVLRDNGGPTKTLALASDSPAVDQIPLAACHITVPIRNALGTPIVQYTITTDQRGMKRPDGNDPFCDIGAYESMNSQA